MKSRKAPRLRHDALDRIDNTALREKLLDVLTVAELNELTRQTENAISRACLETAARATEETYKRWYAVTLRVLRDRFGFGQKRIRALFDACLDYIHDIEAGRIRTEEVLSCLQHDDGINLDWHVKI